VRLVGVPEPYRAERLDRRHDRADPLADAVQLGGGQAIPVALADQAQQEIDFVLEILPAIVDRARRR